MEELWTCIILAIITYNLLLYLLRLPKLPLSPTTRNLFITGCDSGFGRAFATRMDGKGFTVFAGCFTNEGRESLGRSSSPRLHTVHVDITDDDSVRQAAQFVRDQLGPNEGLWALFNNAGASPGAGWASWLRHEDYDAALNVNFHGARRVTDAFLPLIKRSGGGGRIVNTTSIGGILVIPTSVAYCVSKYAAEAYSDAIRRDLRGFGVSVHIVEPSGFRTGLSENMEAHAEAFRASFERTSPEMQAEYGPTFAQQVYETYMKYTVRKMESDLSLVTDCYEHAMLARWPRTRYLPGRHAWLTAWTLSMLPAPIADYLTTFRYPKPARVTGSQSQTDHSQQQPSKKVQ